MAGHVITLYLNEQGHNVTTFSRNTFPFCKNINGDALDKSVIISILKNVEYDVVVNCIGILNQDCNKDISSAVYINSFLPHFIADIIKDTKTKLIHISTDCVFSGSAGSYSESSFRDGESLYDRTKALGEVEDDKNLTFRNSIIGPDMKENGIGLFNWFMLQQGTIDGYSRAIWTGVTTLTLAKAIERASIEKISGIYNLVNNESISKLQLLELFNRHMRENEIIINESKMVVLDKSLVNNRTDFSFVVPSYEEMIVEMKEWINKHKNHYPHYFI